MQFCIFFSLVSQGDSDKTKHTGLLEKHETASNLGNVFIYLSLMCIICMGIAKLVSLTICLCLSTSYNISECSKYLPEYFRTHSPTVSYTDP